MGRILALPGVTERLHGIGFVLAPSTPEEQDKIRREPIEMLSKLVKDAGLKAK